MSTPMLPESGFPLGLLCANGFPDGGRPPEYSRQYDTAGLRLWASPTFSCRRSRQSRVGSMAGRTDSRLVLTSLLTVEPAIVDKLVQNWSKLVQLPLFGSRLVLFPLLTVTMAIVAKLTP